MVSNTHFVPNVGSKPTFHVCAYQTYPSCVCLPLDWYVFSNIWIQISTIPFKMGFTLCLDHSSWVKWNLTTISHWYIFFSHLDPNKCNPISNEICTMFKSLILGKIEFGNHISSQIKLSKSIKHKINYILSQMRFLLN